MVFLVVFHRLTTLHTLNYDEFNLEMKEENEYRKFSEKKTLQQQSNHMRI